MADGFSPYGGFDSSQFSNPYSAYNNQALPSWSYAGWPTDAMGNPIRMPAGMTLNQTPAQPQAPAAAQQPSSLQQRQLNATIQALQNSGGSTLNTNNTLNTNSQAYANMLTAEALRNMQPSAAGNQAAQWQALGSMIPTGNNTFMAGPGTPQGVWGAGQQAAQPAQAATGAGLTPQQYMQLRANPGRVTTPGATVPQSAQDYQPTSGQGGVLQHFLTNWKPATSGPGSQFQQGFAGALRGMGYT